MLPTHTHTHTQVYILSALTVEHKQIETNTGCVRIPLHVGDLEMLKML